MDHFHALQCRAMLGVLRPSHDAWLRHVMRFYSRQFHTPLHQVLELPLDDVLLAYYEESFEQLEEDERDEYVERLTETEEERRERTQADAAGEAAGEDFFEALNEQVEEDVRKHKPAPKLQRRPKPKLPGKLPGRLPGFDSKPPPQPVPPPPEVDEHPVMDMRFDEGGNLSGEDLMSSDPLGPPRKKV